MNDNTLYLSGSFLLLAPDFNENTINFFDVTSAFLVENKSDKWQSHYKNKKLK